MYCYNCGKELSDKAAVCVGCGVSVAAKPDAAKPAGGVHWKVLDIVGISVVGFFTLLAIASMVWANASFVIPYFFICSLGAVAALFSMRARGPGPLNIVALSLAFFFIAMFSLALFFAGFFW